MSQDISGDIRSREIIIIPIDEIVPNPKNRNTHSKEQIERLCEIIRYQGFRIPLIVSNRSGLLVSGHGRLAAARKLGLETLPVIYQDFENEEQEYTAGISDNAIASWAELDLSGINTDIGELGPFDIDMLGMTQFSVVPEFEPGSLEDQGKLDEKKPIVAQCPNCGECFDANENKPKS